LTTQRGKPEERAIRVTYPPFVEETRRGNGKEKQKIDRVCAAPCCGGRGKWKKWGSQVHMGGSFPVKVSDPEGDTEWHELGEQTKKKGGKTRGKTSGTGKENGNPRRERKITAPVHNHRDQEKHGPCGGGEISHVGQKKKKQGEKGTQLLYPEGGADLGGGVGTEQEQDKKKDTKRCNCGKVWSQGTLKKGKTRSQFICEIQKGFGPRGGG